MNPEQQRIAIAKACGIHLHDGDHAPSNYIFPSDLPDYLNDLNAMHEAEKTLDDNQWEFYWYKMANITTGRPTRVCHATAAQRAEAFLKTLNLWKE